MMKRIDVLLRIAAITLIVGCGSDAALAGTVDTGAASSANTLLITGTTSGDIGLYAGPSDSAKTGMRAAAELKPLLPLKIIKESGDFLMVQLDGKAIWLNNYDVSLSRASNYCSQFKGGDVVIVAGTRGIGDICR